jgi:type IV pilus assembly protein PilA
MRAQVTEGLNLADGWKTAVAEFYAQYGSFPDALPATDQLPVWWRRPWGGSIVPSSERRQVFGAITVTCGNQATCDCRRHQDQLALSAYITNTNNDVIWVCGSAAVPASVPRPAAAAGATTVARRSTCRPAATPKRGSSTDLTFE